MKSQSRPHAMGVLCSAVAMFVIACGDCPDGSKPDKNCVCPDMSKPASCTPTTTLPVAGAGSGGNSGGGAGNGPMVDDEGDTIKVSGTFAKNTTWSNTDKVYVFVGDVTVAKGATLRIEPGVLVKSGHIHSDQAPHPLIVEGNLEIAGSESEPVIFTDIGDDTRGGDTNEDEGNRKPRAGLWGGIQFREDATGSIQHAEIHYASTGVTTDRAAPMLDHVRMTNCRTAVSALPTDEVEVTAPDFESNGWNGLLLRDGTIGQDTTWDQSEVPYVFGGEITVAEKFTLTIAKGVLIKSGHIHTDQAPHPLIVEGTLIVDGTESEPVIFTDIGDDTRGGDTNNDEGARKPRPGLWGGIQYKGSRAGGRISFAEIYFARAGISVDSCSPEIRNVHLEQNSVGISATGAGAKPTIHDSRFVDNGKGAVAGGEAVIDATDNWWDASTGPSADAMSEAMGMGNSVTPDVLYEPFLTSEP